MESQAMVPAITPEVDGKELVLPKALLKELHTTEEIAKLKDEALDKFIDQQAGLAMQARMRTIIHVINVGRALIEKRGKMPYGDFRKWAEGARGLKPSSITYWMDMARRSEQLLKDNRNVKLEDLTTRQLKVLTSPPKATPDEGERPATKKDKRNLTNGEVPPKVSEAQEIVQTFVGLRYTCDHQPEHLKLLFEECQKLLKAVRDRMSEGKKKRAPRDVKLVEAIEAANQPVEVKPE